MGLPIVWNGQAVNDSNLQDTVGGPWSRVVDGSLAGNTGRNYTTLQAAWDAASTGDSIFVKSYAYTGGLTVSTGAGNAKHGITVVGESSRVSGGPTFGSIISIENCNDLTLQRLVTSAASADGFHFKSLNRYQFDHLRAVSPGNDGFEFDNLSDGQWWRCEALTPGGRGFVMYDGMLRNHFYGCVVNSPVGIGWSIGAFPTVNVRSDYNWFFGCIAASAAGSSHGFYVSLGSPGTGAKGWERVNFIGCEAHNCGGDGFNVTALNGNTAWKMVGCGSHFNASAGYRLLTAPSSWSKGQFTGNGCEGNGISYVGFPAVLLPGYIGRGLTSTGVNE